MKARRSLHAAALACLAGAALVLYWGSLRYPPLFDDGQLTEHFLRSYGSAPFRLDLRWFAYASFGWTYDLFGRDWFWLRLGNVLLHGAAAAVLYLFLVRLFSGVLRNGSSGTEPAWHAFFGALLFAAHPVAVYGVAYLMQRSIVMATLFSLLSLAFFLEGLLRGSWRWYAAAGCAYFVAVFSKEHCVMLPAVAAALAVLVRGASWRLARELAAPFALFAAIAVLVVLKQRGALGAQYEPFAASAIRQLAESAPASGAAQAMLGEHLYARSIANQALLFFRYLSAWLIPYPGWMSVDLRPAFPASVWSLPNVAAFAAWLAWPVAALALLLRGGRKGLAGFALLAPWLLSLTEVATVRIQEPFVLYRSYLWMCLLPAALPALLAPVPRRWALGLMAAWTLAFVPPFFDRLRSFSSELALWDDAVRKNADRSAPLVERAYRNRGVAHYHDARYDAALQDFERALALDPGSAKAWLTRGTLFMRTGQTEKALADLDRAVTLDPSEHEALGRRCVVLMRLQRYDAALEDCRRALQLDAFDALNHTSLGMAHALRGEVAAAEASYLRALALEPTSGDAHYQYATLLNGTGRKPEARLHFVAACRAGTPKACEMVLRVGPAQ